MVIKVGINGFGRVGRVVFRTCLRHADFQIAAINDPAVEVDYICYLIKFDSTHGKLKGEITHSEDEVKIDDTVIKVLHHKVPSSIPWQTAGVQYVVEASGMFTSLEKASGHLASVGVRRVIVTAPSIDVPMIILGVNDNKLYPEHKVMSCGSSTLYCLAPIVKVLEDSFGVQDGFITSIHAMTPSLKPLDGLCIRGKHWRDHRSIHQNIIPATTGACKALGKIIPQVKDKMTGLAFRVPIVNVSVLDVTIRLKKETTVEGIAQKVERASKSYLQNIIKISCEETVSSDFIGDRCSCILDVNSSLQLNPDFFKLVCWYENEYSYACRVVDSILFSDKQFEQLLLKSKMTYVRPRPSKKQDMVQQTDLCLKVTTEIKYELPKIPFSFSQNDDSRKMISVLPISKKFIPHDKPFQKFDSNREIIKKADLFKIRNDVSKLNKCTHTQQIKNSFFQTNLEDTHSNNCMKAQDRLEKVKIEFSKMVNITEDLLRKSYNSKLKFASNVSKQEINKISSTEMVTNCKREIKKLDSKILESCKYEQTNCRAYKARGDGRPSASTINSNMYNDCSKEDVDSYSMSNDKSNYSDYSVNEIKKPFQRNMDYSPSLSCSPVKPNVIEHMANKNIDTSLNKHSMPETFYLTMTCPLTQNSTQLEEANYSLTSFPVDPATPNVDKRDKSEDAKIDNDNMYCRKSNPTLEPSNINNFKDNFTKTINSLIDGLSKNFQFQPFSGDKNLEPANEATLTNNKSTPSNNAQYQPISIETIATGGIATVVTQDSKQISDLSFSSNSFRPQFSFEEIFRETPSNDNDKDPYMKIFSKSEEISIHNGDTSNSVDDKKHTEDLHQQILKVSKTGNNTASEFIKTTGNEKRNKDYVNSFTNNCSKLNLNVIDEQLKKRNIVIIKDKDDKFNSTSYMVMPDNNTTEIDKYKKLLELHKQNSKSSFRTILNTGNVTKHLSTHNASTVSNGDSLRKQDIYDKLDSASATGSDNSFRIDGRKSQVIQLSDLTTSLDDLERLDKICRIIEISDELSDKLFSALDNNCENSKTAQKKWSFKDLCDKIRLDDFCNKVFKNNF